MIRQLLIMVQGLFNSSLYTQLLKSTTEYININKKSFIDYSKKKNSNSYAKHSLLTAFIYQLSKHRRLPWTNNLGQHAESFWTCIRNFV